MRDLTLTQRELDEIELAMYYDSRLQHGTAGHNRLLLIAKLAKVLGFEFLAPSHDYVFAPDNVTVEKPSGVAEVEINGRKHGVTLTGVEQGEADDRTFGCLEVGEEVRIGVFGGGTESYRKVGDELAIQPNTTKVVAVSPRMKLADLRDWRRYQGPVEGLRQEPGDESAEFDE